MHPATLRAVRLTLIVLAAAALAACESRPKPMGPAATTAPPPAAAPQAEQGAPPPGPVQEQEASGVPVPGSARDFVINVGDRIYFDFDHYDLRDDAKRVIDGQAAWLRRYPAVHVRIEGNCDERGTEDYNFALGARRANSVQEYLVGRGISAARIETVSFGKEHPIDTGAGDEADAHNRNAHSVITQGAR